MSEDRKENTRCGCGCVSALMEILALILICNIIGCQWAKDATHKMIQYVKQEIKQ